MGAKWEQPLPHRVKRLLPTSVYERLAALIAYGGRGSEVCN